MAQFSDSVDDRNKVISVLTVVEGSSALYRLRKGRFMSSAEAASAQSLLTAGLADLIVQPVDAQVIQMAIDMTDRHSLRAMDAIQLGSAIVARALLTAPDMRFIASDKELLDAARAEGFEIWNPAD